MPFRDWKLRLQDILEAVAAGENYVAGMTYEDFIQDQRTVDAVLRRLTIIGKHPIMCRKKSATAIPTFPGRT